MRLIDADELLKRLRRPTDFLEQVNYVTHDGKVYFQDTYIKEIIDSLAQAQPKPNKLDEMIASARYNNLEVILPTALASNVCFIRDSITQVCSALEEISNQLKELRGERD
jgi:hypothetical protein